MKAIEKIVIIGAGNVAWHLSQAFKNAGIELMQVYSRTEASASALAHELDCDYTINIEDIKPGADLYLFSVKDDALSAITADFPFPDAFVAHTSGSLDMDVLQPFRRGVLYPLQTFSKQVKIRMDKVPFCLEAEKGEDLKALQDLAEKISRDVRKIDSGQRELLHIAAVFACNFTNHMYVVAQKILEKRQVDFDVLHPLLDETLRKVKLHKPSEVQTGPAIRNDQQIIKKHLKRLESLPDYQKMYTFISQSIQNLKNKEGE